MLGKIKSKLNKDTNLKEMVSGSLIAFIFKMGGMLLSYLVIYFISKKNGAEGVGYFSITSNILILLAMIAAMGTNVSVLRYVGQYNNDRDHYKLRSLYLNFVKLAFPIALILGSCIVIFSETIAQLIFKDLEYANALIAVGIMLPFFTLDLIAIEFIRGLKKLKISEFIRSVSRPVIILICLYIYWSDSIENILIIYFFCSAIILNSIVSSTVVIATIIPLKRGRGSESLNQLFKVSFPMMITSISAVLMGSISLFILKYFSTGENVGIYDVAMRFSMLISIILIVVNTVSAPKFAELYWANKTKELQVVISQSVKIIFLGALVISIIIAAASFPLLNFFGTEFTKGQVPLFILILGQLFNAATGSVGLFLNMSGRQNILRNTALLSLGIQLILSIILIPIMGMTGAAIASTSGGILWNLLCILYVKRELNIKTYYFLFQNL